MVFLVDETNLFGSESTPSPSPSYEVCVPLHELSDLAMDLAEIVALPPFVTADAMPFVIRPKRGDISAFSTTMAAICLS